MRVLHFLGTGQVPKRPMIDASGGTERVALEIARIQARRGVKVTLASIAPRAWRGTWEGVRLVHLQPHSWAKVRYRGRERDFRAHLSLAACIRMGRYDLVHLHEYSRTRLFRNLPKVVHLHNNPFAWEPEASYPEAAARYWDVVGKTGAQIAVSSFVGHRLALSHQVAGANAPPANIVVNQNGVDAEALSDDERREARARTRRELGLIDSDVLFMFAGAVLPEKGIIQLAQAFAKLAVERPNVFLAIAGGSNLWLTRLNDNTESQVRDVLTKEIEQRRAWLLGVVSPAILPSYYAAADAFVLPTIIDEAFGLVILEAFAAGVPVIGTRVGAVPELVIDDRTGLLVEPSDVEGLYGAMIRLCSDPKLRRRLGKAAREAAVSMSWENTVDRLERIYEDVRAPS